MSNQIQQLYLYIHIVSVGLFLLILISCSPQKSESLTDTKLTSSSALTNPHLMVLGIAQDAGYPQVDCQKSCCAGVWQDKSKRKMVSCLGLRDPSSKQIWLFDATPDFKDQLHILKDRNQSTYKLGGIFLTHAHIGHYTGLMHLGREALGANLVSVFTMPKMRMFLESNGPWDQLVKLQNISLQTINNNKELMLTDQLSVTPLQVPHRDEYSETVGYKIKSLKKSILFIPDIDKWEKWEVDINDLIRQVDYAFIDGSFYQNGEIPGRDMSQIPHPFITESIERFNRLDKVDREKIHFIHLNHTNPLLDPKSVEFAQFNKTDFNLAAEGEIIPL